MGENVADIQTGMYSLSNQVDPVKSVQEGLNLGKDQASAGYNLQKLAMDTKTAQDTFNDQQLARKAFQQHVDALGNLDKHAALVQIGQQNPIFAKQLDTQMTKYGVEGAAAHAERMQQFYANVTPENYAKEKQKLIDENIDEAKQLPDYLPETSRLRGLIATASASQQMDFLKNQAQHEFEIRKQAAEKGVDPNQYLPPSLFDIYGRNKMNGQDKAQPQGAPANQQAPQPYDRNRLPGVNRIPGGDLDRAGLKVGTDELKARTEQSDYVTAQNNLLAGKNFMSLVNKGDPNNMSNQQLTLAAAELGKMAASKSPTDADMEHLTPENRFTMQAKWLSRISGKPEAANQGEFIQQMKEYAQDLMQNSADVLRAHHKQAYDMALAGGASPETANRFANANENKVRSLLGEGKSGQPSGKANNQPQLSPNDQKALEWAKSNPNDPDAQYWLKRHGVSK